MLKGFNKRLKSVEERTTRTLGPVSGDYGIEWANARNATPASGAEAPRITKTGNRVNLVGKINFTGAGADDDVFFNLPEGLRPEVTTRFLVMAWDNSIPSNIVGYVTIETSGDVYVGFLTGTVAVNDILFLSGSFVFAKSD